MDMRGNHTEHADPLPNSQFRRRRFSPKHVLLCMACTPTSGLPLGTTSDQVRMPCTLTLTRLRLKSVRWRTAHTRRLRPQKIFQVHILCTSWKPHRNWSLKIEMYNIQTCRRKRHADFRLIIKKTIENQTNAGYNQHHRAILAFRALFTFGGVLFGGEFSGGTNAAFSGVQSLSI